MAIKCPKCQHENPPDTAYCGKCATPLPDAKEAVHTKTMETPTEELTTGSTFANRYQIIEELGKGGMGKVYKVHDMKIKEKVALKLIRHEIASDKKTLERFSNELKFARKIRHKNICQMFDLSEDKGSHFITMEFVEGQDLRKLIRQSGQLAIGTLINISKQVCDGLVEAHESGVVHRDLKPSNIMIDADGNARIMDFGIARSIRGKGITGQGVMIGTPEYMSPEQVEAKEVDQRSDIYSLGIILYEMTTGQLPFVADTPFAVGVKQKSEEPKNPKDINPQVPDDFNQVILKCLEKDKDKRFQSAGEVRSELENIEKGIPTTEREEPKKKPLTSKEITVTFGLNKLFVPVLIILALAVIVVVMWQILPQKEALQAPIIKNSVAVISFENLTGEEKYDFYRRSIPNLLITNLENAGFSYVVSWERMRDLLKQIGVEELEVIESEAGFEICRREGVEALVTGSINKAGDMFAIELRILDVETKRHIKTATSRGVGEQSIIESQIDELSREIAQGIGIAQKKIEESRIQITDVTTNSIEAYNHYLKGVEEFYKVYLDAAQESLKKAVAIDPTFATAYRYLSLVHNQAENPKAMEEALIKAKAYSDKTTEKEKLFIEATYAVLVDRDINQSLNIYNRLIEKYHKEKQAYFWLGVIHYLTNSNDEAIEAQKKALKLDPEFGEAMNMIAYSYAAREDYDEALAYFEKYAFLNPEDANPLDSMAELYFLMGRLDDAIAKYEEALKVKPDFGSDWRMAYIYALKEDYAEAMKRIEQYIFMGASPGRRASGHFWKGFYHYWLGNMTNCLKEFQVAEDQSEKMGNRDIKARIDAMKGWIYCDRGDFELSRQYFKIWFDFITDKLPLFEQSLKTIYLIDLGFLDLKQGQIDRAKARADQIASILPEISFENKDHFQYLHDLFQGEISLAEGSVQQAIAFGEKTAGTIFHIVTSSSEAIVYNMPFFKDVLARAYVENGELDRAIAAYEKLITFDPQQKGRFLIHPMYHYRLANLYQEKDWKGKAIEQYEIFLNLWKDADPDISEVEDAKERLAGLK